MSDDYLWDRSGDPDPEIEKLEKLLAGFRPPETRPAPWRPARSRVPLWLAAAASVALAIFAARAFLPEKAASTASAWRVTLGNEQPRTLAIGQTLNTGSASAKLDAEFFGELHLSPESSLRVLHSSDNRQHLALQRGTLHALIWAPPRKFVVDTPSAATVDLGCEYTLRVLPDGSGLLNVERGWVAFQAGSVESFIPAGAACHTRPQNGPGIPYFEDAPAALRSALEKFDTTNGTEGLSAVLANARPRDALSLWHLLVRTENAQRRQVAEKFAQLVPGVNMAGLEKRDPAAIDAAWDALGLGETGWWRTWKRKW
jgi:hypothetical protein